MTQVPTSRLAPSPSGRMHLGNIYAFLVAWTIARQTGAVVRLRIDDLDERCQNKDVKQQLIKDLMWLGIDWNSEIVWQSKRMSLYEEAWHELQKTDLLYPCFCSRADLHAASAPHASDGAPIYARTCKNLTENEIKNKTKLKQPAWRIEVPNETISFKDELFGLQNQNLQKDSGDFILRRSDGVFSYQFCNAVDDVEMGITEIVRGCDLITSVCRELYLFKLLPSSVTSAVNFCHIPMFVNGKGLRLAKRDKSLDIGVMQASGLCASDIIGKVAWTIGLTNEQSRLTSDEFSKLFNLNILKEKKEFVV